jgi:hypothetical protein
VHAARESTLPGILIRSGYGVVTQAELLYAAEVQIDKLLAARSYPMLDHSSIILKAVPA